MRESSKEREIDTEVEKFKQSFEKSKANVKRLFDNYSYTYYLDKCNHIPLNTIVLFNDFASKIEKFELSERKPDIVVDACQGSIWLSICVRDDSNELHDCPPVVTAVVSFLGEKKDIDIDFKKDIGGGALEESQTGRDDDEILGILEANGYLVLKSDAKKDAKKDIKKDITISSTLVENVKKFFNHYDAKNFLDFLDIVKEFDQGTLDEFSGFLDRVEKFDDIDTLDIYREYLSIGFTADRGKESPLETLICFNKNGSIDIDIDLVPCIKGSTSVLKEDETSRLIDEILEVLEDSGYLTLKKDLDCAEEDCLQKCSDGEKLSTIHDDKLGIVHEIRKVFSEKDGDQFATFMHKVSYNEMTMLIKFVSKIKEFTGNTLLKTDLTGVSISICGKRSLAGIEFSGKTILVQMNKFDSAEKNILSFNKYSLNDLLFQLSSRGCLKLKEDKVEAKEADAEQVNQVMPKVDNHKKLQFDWEYYVQYEGLENLMILKESGYVFAVWHDYNIWQMGNMANLSDSGTPHPSLAFREMEEAQLAAEKAVLYRMRLDRNLKTKNSCSSIFKNIDAETEEYKSDFSFRVKDENDGKEIKGTEMKKNENEEEENNSENGEEKNDSENGEELEWEYFEKFIDKGKHPWFEVWTTVSEKDGRVFVWLNDYSWIISIESGKTLSDKRDLVSFVTKEDAMRSFGKMKIKEKEKEKDSENKEEENNSENKEELEWEYHKRFIDSDGFNWVNTWTTVSKKDGRVFVWASDGKWQMASKNGIREGEDFNSKEDAMLSVGKISVGKIKGKSEIEWHKDGSGSIALSDGYWFSCEALKYGPTLYCGKIDHAKTFYNPECISKEIYESEEKAKEGAVAFIEKMKSVVPF